MKIIEASFTFNNEIDENIILKNIEKAGRICYKSERKTTESSAEEFVKNLIKKDTNQF